MKTRIFEAALLLAVVAMFVVGVAQTRIETIDAAPVLMPAVDVQPVGDIGPVGVLSADDAAELWGIFRREVAGEFAKLPGAKQAFFAQTLGLGWHQKVTNWTVSAGWPVTRRHIEASMTVAGISSLKDGTARQAAIFEAEMQRREPQIEQEIETALKAAGIRLD